jgi:plasmid stabilization system protein ParE
MNRFDITFSVDAKEDIQRLDDFLAAIDPNLANKAMDVLEDGWEILSKIPHTCRKAQYGELGPAMRELLVNFGSSGYVALFEITDASTVTVLAVRHQRESDFH